MKIAARLVLGLRVVGATLSVPSAWAGDLWASSAWFPQTARSASTSLGGMGVVGYESGLVPPFRVAERARLSVGAESGVRLDRVALRASWSWLRDATEEGAPVSGPGDVRLGTSVEAARFGGADAPGARLWVGWEAKLPDASDEGELGTDETDVLVGGGADVAWGPLDARLGLGLAILGNPLRFANQDDVPLVRAAVGTRAGPARLGATLAADLGTSRNPARVTLGGEIVAGQRLFCVVEGGVGLTPAAADGAVMLGLGWRGALPDGPAGE